MQLFCFPCRIFGSATAKYDKSFALDGFRDWKVALETGRGLAKHNSSQQHAENVQKWQLFLTSEMPIEQQLSAQWLQQLELRTKEWENRHKSAIRLADIAATLARLRLPFRGHDESKDSSNKGVFRERATLVACYDPVIKEHLDSAQRNPKGISNYLSAQSQNEIIMCGASQVRITIIEEVKQAVYFSESLNSSTHLWKILPRDVACFLQYRKSF
ncbi:UNVERIFIED_CONTAM: hypothetical protein FKN15_032636 [Acipenser sinensis]